MYALGHMLAILIDSQENKETNKGQSKNLNKKPEQVGILLPGCGTFQIFLVLLTNAINI